MATKKTAKKTAAKPKAMTTDEALAMLEKWRRKAGTMRSVDVRFTDDDMSGCADEWVAAVSTKDQPLPKGAWRTELYGVSKSLSVAITKALAAAKKAGHA